jgi:hypothetical protein
MLLCWNAPGLGERSKLGDPLWPVVKDCRVKIRAIGPDKGVNFRVYPNLIKKLWVPKWAVQLAFQYRLEINDLRGTVIEIYSQGERSYLLESHDPVYLVSHLP